MNEENERRFEIGAKGFISVATLLIYKKIFCLESELCDFADKFVFKLFL